MYRKNAPALGRPIAFNNEANEKNESFIFRIKLQFFLTRLEKPGTTSREWKKLLPAVLDNFELVSIGDGARV